MRAISKYRENKTNIFQARGVGAESRFRSLPKQNETKNKTNTIQARGGERQSERTIRQNNETKTKQISFQPGRGGVQTLTAGRANKSKKNGHLSLKCHHNICMVNRSGLSALPLLHYRECYGRPKSKLQRPCISSSHCCSIARSRSPLVTHVLPWRSFRIAPSRSLSLPVLRRRCCLRRRRRRCHRRRCWCCLCLCFAVVAISCLVCESPPAETRLTVYCWLCVWCE